MPFKTINKNDIAHFNTILSPAFVRCDNETLQNNSHDQTEDVNCLPETVLLPKTSKEVQKIMGYCFEQNIPVTPRGAGTGLSGGALPVLGGVSLDLQRMNQIIGIDTDNFQVTTEPGVITEVLQNEVAKYGLFYPVDPASRGSCFIGGNVAESSGGPRAVKYGTVKDYVLNLEAVLPNGDLIETGANTLKNATGYDLTRLLVGSEGTLAVITKITLKLLTLPAKQLLMLAPFTDAQSACRAVNVIMKTGITPSALDFMERDALILAQDYIANTTIDIPEKIQAHLLIEVDGNDTEMLFKQAEAINSALRPLTNENILLAETEQEQNKLWRLRRIVGEAVKKLSVYKEEDTVVPNACLPDLLAFVKKTGRQYGFRSVCYGHAGDGNLHVNILKDNLTDEQWQKSITEAVKEIFQFVKSKGGTISGEHGIGYVQKSYLNIVFSQETIRLMRNIKNAFDPKGILNPEKIFPDM